MSKLNPTDIQGFVIRGYSLPLARYVFLHLSSADQARKLIGRLLGRIMSIFSDGPSAWRAGCQEPSGRLRTYGCRKRLRE